MHQHETIQNAIVRCHGNLGALTSLFFKHGKQINGEVNPHTREIFEALKASFEEALGNLEYTQREVLKRTYTHYSKIEGCSIFMELETSIKIPAVSVVEESIVVPFETNYTSVAAVAIA